MYNVRQILQTKGDEIWFVTPETSTCDALAQLADRDVGALLVLDGEKLVGIISERDFVRRIAQDRSCRLDAPVSDIMTREVICVTPDHTLQDCMAVMTENRIRHLPVIDAGSERLVGVISIGDVVKNFIEDREEQIHSLENYILGVGYGQ